MSSTDILAETNSKIASGKPRNVLLIEDDRSLRLFVEHQLMGLGYQVSAVASGEEALDLLERTPHVADVVLLDRMLPGMNGNEFVHRCHANTDWVGKPIIMLTGASGISDIRSSIDAGVFYYLVKPVDVGILQSVVSAAMRRVEMNRKLQRQINACRYGMSCVQSAKFQFRTPDEAEMLAILLSGSFPDPGRALVGVSELMLNAIEHGNLEIGAALKDELLELGRLEEEIERRLKAEPYQSRIAEVLVTKKPEGTYVVITDGGSGFDPRAYVVLDPARARKRNGRGIAQARTISFDKVTYNKIGNQVMGFVSNEAQLAW